MAALDIAFVASAGSVALAVGAGAWLIRARSQWVRQAAALAGQLAGTEARLAETRTALEAFDGALIRVDDGQARLLAGGDALEACAQALGLELDADQADAAETVLKALADAAEETTRRLQALIDQGEACRFMVAGPAGSIMVDGRPMGGQAWLSLSAAADGPVLEEAVPGLADRLPTPLWLTDAAGRLVWANQAWLEAVEQPTLAEARAAGAVFERQAPALAEQALRTGRRADAFGWAHVGGQRRAWRLVSEPLGEGQVLSYALDASEAEETRETLKQHVAAHDETLNHLADAVAIFGPNRRLSFYNTAFQTLFGLDAAWLDERPSHGELLDHLRQRRRLPETRDYTAFKARELEFYASTEVAPDDVWSLPGGRTLRVVRQPHPMGGLLLLLSDITDDLQLRAGYNALLQVQRATLDKLNDAVAVFGSDGQLRLRNEAFERFWGLNPAELETADISLVVRHGRSLLDDAALWEELRGRITDPDPESRTPVAGEARLTDGRYVAWQTRPLPDGATLLAFADVTARRDLEQALSAREAALSESERLKREFVGSVSYELRTPLTTIVGYAELLEHQSQGLPDTARAQLAAVRSAAGQLARSIDDVLDMAQIDADEMALSLGPVLVGDLVRGVVDRMAARAADRQVALAIDLPSAEVAVSGDLVRLGQVMDHLLDNALRATPPGGEVTVAATAEAGRVRIRVRDTGRGIPYQQQAHVFDRFVTRERGGPGLGLALVKALVGLHGGQVAVESEPGQGATFIVDLPRADQAALAVG